MTMLYLVGAVAVGLASVIFRQKFLTVIAFLGFGGICCSEPIQLEIIVSPIGFSNHAVKATFEEDALTITRVGEGMEVFRLGPRETRLLRSAIIASSPKDWSGFWASLDYLDGYILSARLEHDGKKHAFGGWNGCPEGFAAILKRINEITKIELFSTNWEEKEIAAKRYKSFEDFTETTAEAAKEKRTNLKANVATPRKPSD